MRNILSFLFFTGFSFLCFSGSFSSGKTDAEVIKHISWRRVVKDKLIRQDTLILQINKRMGDDLARIRIPYSKGESVAIEEAKILNNKGEIVRKLKKTDIKDISAVSGYSLYEDEYVKEFELKHNEYPYRIEYSVKHTSSAFLYIAAFSPYSYYYPARHMKLVAEVPAGYGVTHKEINADAPEIEYLPEITRLEWNTAYEPEKKEINAPFSALPIPQIYILPLHFKYGVPGSWNSWEDFGDWIWTLNEKSRVLPEAEKIKVNNLLEGIEDKREKVGVLYRYMQENTRYINVKIDVGGMKSYPAAYVVKNRYGDCKALCNYLQAMLEHAGIEAFYTLVRSGKTVRDIPEDFPCQAFDHVILTVPLEKDTVFLECTAKNIPMGYMGTFTQGRKAFLIEKNKSRFITIPALTEEEVTCERKIHASLLKGTSMVKVEMKQRGEEYAEALFLSTSVNRNRMEKYIRDKEAFTIVHVQDIAVSQPSAEVAEIDIYITGNIKDIYKQHGNNLIVTSFSRELPLYEEPAKRTQPVRLDYPFCVADTVFYKLEEGKTPEIISPDMNVRTPFGSYTVHHEIKEGMLIVSKNILIRKGTYSPEEYPSFYQFISEIRKNEKKSIYLNALGLNEKKDLEKDTLYP